MPDADTIQMAHLDWHKEQDRLKSLLRSCCAFIDAFAKQATGGAAVIPDIREFAKEVW